MTYPRLSVFDLDGHGWQVMWMDAAAAGVRLTTKGGDHILQRGVRKPELESRRLCQARSRASSMLALTRSAEA